MAARNGMISVAAGTVLLALATVPSRAADQGAITTLERNGRFDAFVAAARASGLDDVLAASEEGRTIFAPTDEAFARLPEDVVERLAHTGNGALRRLLARHIVPEGPYPADALPKRMRTLGEGRIDVRVAGGGVVVSLGAGPGARVVVPGIAAEQVLVHGIDRVLVPGDPADTEATPDSEQAVIAILRGEAKATPPEDSADGQDFVEAIAAADEGRVDGGLVPETDEPFAGAVDIGEEEGLRFSAQDMTVITLGGDRRDAAPGLEDAGRIVTLPPDARDRMVDRVAARNGAAQTRPDPASNGRAEDGTSGSATPTGSEPASKPAASTKMQEGTGEAATLALSRDSVSVADLLGREVRDPSGERLGEVDDVFLSLDTGVAERIVVEVDSGFLGLFDRTTSVAPAAIAIDPLDGAVVVQRSALEAEGGDGGE